MLCSIAGGEKGPGTHCFDGITLQHDYQHNVREALYVPHLLVEGPPKALHCLVQPEQWGEHVCYGRLGVQVCMYVCRHDNTEITPSVPRNV